MIKELTEKLLQVKSHGENLIKNLYKNVSFMVLLLIYHRGDFLLICFIQLLRHLNTFNTLILYYKILIFYQPY